MENEVVPAVDSSNKTRRLSSRELMMLEMTNQNREFSGTNPMPLNSMGANVSTPPPTATSSTNHWNRMKRLTNGTGAFKHSGKQRAVRLAKSAVTETNATPRVNNDTGAAMAPGEVLMSDERMRSTFSPDGRFQAVYDEDSDNVTIFDTER